MDFASTPGRVRGWTIVELIAVLLIAGILAVMTTSVFRRGLYDTRAATDELRATLGFVQKVAIAARRAVRVTRSGDTLAFALCTAAVATGDLCPTAGSGWTTMNGPKGLPGWTAPTTVTLGGFGTLHFDSVGRPVDASGVALSTQTLTMTSSETVLTLTIEAETGHVW